VYVTTPDGLTAARSIIFLIGAATQDRGYYSKDLAFYRQLQRLGVHTELISVVGSHSWQTWGSQFAKALPLLEPPLVKAHQSNSRSL
jgi:S-formylglutathione hydrolase FrmB